MYVCFDSKVEEILRVGKEVKVTTAFQLPHDAVYLCFDSKVEEILRVGKEMKVEIVFAMKRRELAVAAGKKGRVSIVGVKDYSGAEKEHTQIMKMVRGCALKGVFFDGENSRL